LLATLSRTLSRILLLLAGLLVLAALLAALVWIAHLFSFLSEMYPEELTPDGTFSSICSTSIFARKLSAIAASAKHHVS
jgi:hypothetical protein